MMVNNHLPNGRVADLRNLALNAQWTFLWEKVSLARMWLACLGLQPH
jgi:hypothetical protein